MTDFQEVSRDDNHVTVRFKQGKHEYDAMIDYGVMYERGETEAAVTFSITVDPNPDWRKQGRFRRRLHPRGALILGGRYGGRRGGA